MSRMDVLLLVVVVSLTLFGLLMIYDASSYIAFRDFSDKYHYSKEQLKWIIVGIAGLSFFSFFDYRKMYNLSLPILITAIGLLILVFVPGVGIGALGARRWINIGIFILQPAEFVKLALTIYLAAWFSQKEKERFFAFLLLLGLVVSLIMLEPDMGTAAIILLLSLVMYFISGGSIMHFVTLLPAVFIAGFFLIRIASYRLARLTSFLNVDKSISSASYHVKQILISLGMGGLWGVGLGNSLQKYAYLPENTTDSIFAIIAEEIGFVGSCAIIFLFLVIIWRGFKIAALCSNRFGKLLAGGISSFLAIQTLINLGSQTALLPLAGVPLPFISYGGSSLVVALCAIGILINISKQSHT